MKNTEKKAWKTPRVVLEEIAVSTKTGPLPNPIKGENAVYSSS